MFNTSSSCILSKISSKYVCTWILSYKKQSRYWQDESHILICPVIVFFTLDYCNMLEFHGAHISILWSDHIHVFLLTVKQIKCCGRFQLFTYKKQIDKMDEQYNMSSYICKIMSTFFWNIKTQTNLKLLTNLENKYDALLLTLGELCRNPLSSVNAICNR